MPPIVFELAAKYGSRALAILLLILSIVAGYYYWKHQVATEARDEAIADCNDSKEKFRIDAEHFRQARQEEVDKLKAEQDERLKNAIQTYIAQVNGNARRQYLGQYSTPEEAFYAYKAAKEKRIKEVAEDWKDQIDPRVYEALMKYEVDIHYYG